jgi:hypothetical protein
MQMKKERKKERKFQDGAVMSVSLVAKPKLCTIAAINTSKLSI